MHSVFLFSLCALPPAVPTFCRCVLLLPFVWCALRNFFADARCHLTRCAALRCSRAIHHKKTSFPRNIRCRPVYSAPLRLPTPCALRPASAFIKTYIFYFVCFRWLHMRAGGGRRATAADCDARVGDLMGHLMSRCRGQWANCAN